MGIFTTYTEIKLELLEYIPEHKEARVKVTKAECDGPYYLDPPEGRDISIIPLRVGKEVVI